MNTEYFICNKKERRDLTGTIGKELIEAKTRASFLQNVALKIKHQAETSWIEKDYETFGYHIFNYGRVGEQLFQLKQKYGIENTNLPPLNRGE